MTRELAPDGALDARPGQGRGPGGPAPGGPGPGGPRRRRTRPTGRARWWRRHRILSSLLALLTVLAVIAAPSLIPALTRPGTDTLAARLAEWARTHGFSSLINASERVQYNLSPPRIGGTPSGLPALPTAAPVHHPVVNPAALALPPPVPLLAQPPLPGEGSWKVVDTVLGLPALAVTFLRPDARHTSYLSGLVWMNPRLLRLALHPGSVDPGAGSWGQPDTLPLGQRQGLLAAFNSGFRLYASRGGYYSYGHTAQSLRVGAASLVITTNGGATVGQWGRDVSMTPAVAAVRQNLDLIVDGGQLVPGLDQNVQQDWGATLGNKYYVWRSGIGVLPDGALIYAAGAALSVSSLARLMQRAGSVRAMELDINPEWTSFVLYDTSAQPGDPVPRNLLPDMQQPADRYYQTVSRDFFSVYARPAGSR